MKCTYCGMENSIGFDFCYNCGNGLVKLAKPREAVLQLENSLLWAVVLIGVVAFMGFFGFQLMHTFSDILRQLP